jgi:asparagine synthase (glutamine-hydrolysing)
VVDKYFDFLPMFFRKLIKKSIKNIKSKRPLVRRLKKLTKSIDKTKNERLVAYFEWQEFDFIKSVFKEKHKVQLKQENTYFKKLLSDVNDLNDELNKLLYLEIYTFLIDHNLNYSDKAGMANSVEIRVPYLDIELVEFSTKIPVNLKMKGNETKYILRKVAERYLPKEVIYRSKVGFGAPIEHWVRNELDNYIGQNLAKEAIEKADIFDFEKVDEVTQLNKTGKINASYNVWSFLAIESWYKQFLK